MVRSGFLHPHPRHVIFEDQLPLCRAAAEVDDFRKKKKHNEKERQTEKDGPDLLSLGDTIEGWAEAVCFCLSFDSDCIYLL